LIFPDHLEAVFQKEKFLHVWKNKLPAKVFGSVFLVFFFWWNKKLATNGKLCFSILNFLVEFNEACLVG
jgi:uncharacterized protein (DUF2062 family)